MDKYTTLKRTFTREIPEEYKDLIGIGPFFEGRLNPTKAEHGDCDYVWVAANANVPIPGFRNNLQRIAGKSFVDLGCSEVQDTIIDTIREFGPKEYIGVEIIEVDEGHRNREGLDTYLFRSDMLEFLARVPRFNEGAIFMLAGIDPYSQNSDTSLRPEFSKKEEYMKALIKEIDRLSKHDDLVITAGRTYHIPKMLADSYFEKVAVFKPEREEEVCIFKK